MQYACIAYDNIYIYIYIFIIICNILVLRDSSTQLYAHENNFNSLSTLC